MQIGGGGASSHSNSRLPPLTSGWPAESIVETVAQLHKKFARIQVVGAAEGEAVVEEDAAVGDVDRLQVDGEFVAELLAERNVEGGVRLQVAWWRTAVGESGRVIHVRRGGEAARQLGIGP